VSGLSIELAGAGSIAGDAAPSHAGVGPVDREHFLDAQRRHRRATWRATAIAVPSVMAAGIPLCVIVTPLLLAPLILAAVILKAVGALPPGLWEWAYRSAHLLPESWSAIWNGTPVSASLLVTTFILPGAFAMLLVWLALRLLLGRAWIGSVASRLGGRAPDPRQAAERALCNIAQELAVAAAVGPPRILIIDSHAANALVIGHDPREATLIVSSGLLESLDRDEVQAVVAHLIVSVGNGDLRIASTFFSIFQAWGVLSLLIETPFNGEARKALRRTFRVLLDAARGRRDPEAARAAVDDLLDGAAAESSGFERYMDRIEHEWRPIRNLLIDLPRVLTFCIVAVTARLAIALSTALLFGPPISALWRSRRRLADSGAVELTRHPAALAAAVEKLHHADVELEGGDPVSFLFPLWPKRDPADESMDIAGHVIGMQLDPHKRLQALRRLGSGRDVTVALSGWEGWRKEAKDVPMFIMALVLALCLIGFMFALSLAGLGGFLLLLWTALDATVGAALG
jgi:Zn-dependent protease with chaperone function